MRRSLLLVLVAAPLVVGAASTAPADTVPTTAWRAGSFHVDARGVVGRSDVVLGRPNALPSQAMPLGNGSLGAAVWAADGLSAQLNRADTLPDRLSPGVVVVPGLAALTGAADYSGRLDLYDGAFVQSGGGMTATTYVRSDADELVVDVTGADPYATETVDLHLWPPRTPTASASGKVGVLAGSWFDNTRVGAAGQQFGASAAVTARGRFVRAAVVDPLTVRVTFRPMLDGTFRILVASPSWTGGDPAAVAAQAAADAPRPALADATASWWHRYWGSIGLIRLQSPDGAAQYLESVRTISLYAAAAESGTVRPGSQAGVADLFDSTQDVHSWDPAAYWGWNLRMLVSANLGAGAFANNDGYFALYRTNLPAIERWTAQQFPGLSGACTPETMRFNGVGVVVHQSGGRWGTNPALTCSALVPPGFNARTISTGAEVSYFIWQTYLATDDVAFLRANYPIMRDWGLFMLSYAKVGADGLLHTSPSNAHETQFDVSDPTTDLAAMNAVLPVVADAATLLRRDPDLVPRLDAASDAVPPYPRTDGATLAKQLTAAADATGEDVIGYSYQQSSTTHNAENLGLEPVWPYGLIGDDGPLTELARRTFAMRPSVERYDWSLDPIDAARLGLAPELEQTLVDLTSMYQRRVSGLASFGGAYPEPYAEQGAVVATALQDALVQDYDGLVRIAPALPSTWSADGTVFIRHRARVDVQVRHGVPTTVVIESGNGGVVRMRSPWPGRLVAVTQPTGRVRRIAPAVDGTFRLSTEPNAAYLLAPAGAPAGRYAPVTGRPATSYRTLGHAQIGLPPPS